MNRMPCQSRHLVERKPHDKTCALVNRDKAVTFQNLLLLFYGVFKSMDFLIFELRNRRKIIVCYDSS